MVLSTEAPTVVVTVCRYAGHIFLGHWAEGRLSSIGDWYLAFGPRHFFYPSNFWGFACLPKVNVMEVMQSISWTDAMVSLSHTHTHTPGRRQTHADTNTHTHTHTRMQTQTHTDICTHTETHTRADTDTHRNTETHTHLKTQKHTRTYADADICTHTWADTVTHRHTQTHPQTHTHTCTQKHTRTQTHADTDTHRHVQMQIIFLTLCRTILQTL